MDLDFANYAPELLLVFLAYCGSPRLLCLECNSSGNFSRGQISSPAVR